MPRKQQARISFSPLPSTSPAAKDYPQQIKDRAAAVRYEVSGSSPLKRRRIDSSSPARARSDYLLTPDSPPPATRVMSQNKHKLKRVRQQRLDLTALTPTTQSRSSPPPQDASADATIDQSSDSDELPRKSSKKRRLKDGFMSSARTSRGQRQINLDVSYGMPTPVTASSPQQDSDSGDDMPTTAGIRKRGQRKRQLSPSPSIHSPSEDEVEVVEVRKHVSDNDDEDDLPLPTPRRRLLKRPPKLTQQDREDLNEDLDFLDPSSDVDTPKRPRDSQSIRKNARMAALDALKRKRSGAAEPEEAPEEFEEELEEESDVEYTAPASSRSMFQAEEDDEDFLDDDAANGTLGVPEDLPIEFSKYASMKPKDLFKYAVEWMVQKKINPAFSIKDNLYDLTFTKLNDEVSGLVSSKYSSSAWTSDFTLALRARPSMAIDDLRSGTADDFLAGHCDACNRSNHPATFAIQFQGKPYHLDTLDDVEIADKDESGSDSDEQDDDQACYDAQGRHIPPASRVYQVGRFCAANAETGHELSHWKLNLYKWVVEWIDEQGYNTAANIVQRDSWSTKKRRKYANKIADRMTDMGVTKKLWKDFQDTISRARESKQGRFD